MNEYKYILEPYKGMNTRYSCPICQQRHKTFTLYIDKETGEYLNPTVGRCNRESNCGYHYPPKQYFQDNNISFDVWQQKLNNTPNAIAIKKDISFIDFNKLKESLKEYESNNLIQYLRFLGNDALKEVLGKYYIGTSNYWRGATIFWQIDISGKIRTGKIMLYSPITGKRVKEPFNHIAWVHKSYNEPDYVLKQCFFGEHLLSDKTKPVALVESEKTAIISSLYLPQFIWLATGGISNLNIEKCSILIGRDVVLFPDVNAYAKWLIIADVLKQKIRVVVSDLLETKASEEDRVNGLDIADYLIKMNLSDFRTSDTVNTFGEFKNNEYNVLVNPQTSYSNNTNQRRVRESWSFVIDELENYFNSVSLSSPIRINQCTVVYDVAEFIRSHISVLRNNNCNPHYLPFFDRLITLKTILK